MILTTLSVNSTQSTTSANRQTAFPTSANSVKSVKVHLQPGLNQFATFHTCVLGTCTILLAFRIFKASCCQDHFQLKTKIESEHLCPFRQFKVFVLRALICYCVPSCFVSHSKHVSVDPACANLALFGYSSQRTFTQVPNTSRKAVYFRPAAL